MVKTKLSGNSGILKKMDEWKMDIWKMSPLILLVKLSLKEWVSLSGCNEEKSQLQKNVAVIFHIF